eukprot:12852723-Prorocentrum_lima.AAC.1
MATGFSRNLHVETCNFTIVFFVLLTAPCTWHVALVPVSWEKGQLPGIACAENSCLWHWPRHDPKASRYMYLPGNQQAH